ncbi:hypothetical protein HK103_006556 [Boothiomyces macroporosus]|uniref:Uncharacterized protein n=1 Tax=Boothiomyces macroporosus TaxID=261099 RepID=A0AAD5Y4L4_9FUNG|nr:hypothetical protein HK103_006556 [Boothiomyces macroporosus]
MHLIFALLLTCCSSHVPFGVSRHRLFQQKSQITGITDIQYQFFQQPRDHFTPSDTTTWQQAYYEFNTYYQSGGPVFLSISGESQMNSSFIGYGLEAQLAEKYNGLVINLEHRYYDLKNQFPQDYPSDFALLTTSQALQDIAGFIRFRRTLLPADTVWVAIGGSYAGNLAAWSRLKFPDLIYAAHSSSAPVLSTSDFYQYGVAVQAGIQYSGGSATCATNWQRAVKLFDNYMIQQGYSDDKKFKYSSYSTLLASAVQYGRDITNPPKMGPICGGVSYPAFTDPSATDSALLDAYQQVVSAYSADSSSGARSNPLYNVILPSSDSDNQRNSVAWLFQSCYEFGYLQDYTNQESTAYSQFRTLSFYLSNVCQDLFGVQPSSDLVNAAYMGLNITSAISRIVYVHGTVDPWHTIGVRDVGSTDNVFIRNEMGHHCDDLAGSYGISPSTLNRIMTAWDSYLGNNPKNTFNGSIANTPVKFVNLPPIPSGGNRLTSVYVVDYKKLTSFLVFAALVAVAIIGFICYRRRSRNQGGLKQNIFAANGHIVAQRYFNQQYSAPQPIYPQQQYLAHQQLQGSIPAIPQYPTQSNEQYHASSNNTSIPSFPPPSHLESPQIEYPGKLSYQG